MKVKNKKFYWLGLISSAVVTTSIGLSVGLSNLESHKANALMTNSIDNQASVASARSATPRASVAQFNPNVYKDLNVKQAANNYNDQYIPDSNGTILATFDNVWNGSYTNITRVYNSITNPGVVIGFSPWNGSPSKNGYVSNIKLYSRPMFKNRQIFNDYFNKNITTTTSKGQTLNQQDRVKQAFYALTEPKYGDPSLTSIPIDSLVKDFMLAIIDYYQGGATSQCGSTPVAFFPFFKDNAKIDGIKVDKNTGKKSNVKIDFSKLWMGYNYMFNINGVQSKFEKNLKSYSNDDKTMDSVVVSYSCSDFSFSSNYKSGNSGFSVSAANCDFSYIPSYIVRDYEELDINNPAIFYNLGHKVFNGRGKELSHYISSGKAPNITWNEYALKDLLWVNRHQIFGNTSYKLSDGSTVSMMYDHDTGGNNTGKLNWASIQINNNKTWYEAPMAGNPNSEGKLHINVTINYEPSITTEIVIKGFNVDPNTFNTTLKNSTVDVSKKAPNAKNVNAKNLTPNDIKKYVEDNKDVLFDNYPKQMQVSNLNGLIDYSNWAAGEITIKNIPLIYTYVNNEVQPSPINFGSITLTGFSSNFTAAETNTSIQTTGGTLSQVQPWTETTPQALFSSTNKTQYIEKLKQQIIDDHIISQASLFPQFTTSDFDLTINSLDDCYNDTGELTVEITFHPGKFYISGRPSTTSEKRKITIGGFEKLPVIECKETSPGSGQYNAVSKYDYDKYKKVPVPVNVSDVFGTVNPYSLTQQNIQDKFDADPTLINRFFNNTIVPATYNATINDYLKATKLKIDSISVNGNDINIFADVLNYNWDGSGKGSNHAFYGDSLSDAWHVVFTLTGFNASQTGWTRSQISFSDPLFQAIFGPFNEFSADFAKNVSNNQSSLNGYISTHLSDFISNVDSNTRINSVTLSTNGSNYVANIDYQGYDATGLNSHLTASMDIILKPNPTSAEITDGFDQVLQDWINNNSRFPSDNDLKTIITNFLGTRISVMPHSWVPASGFSPNSVSINTNKIHKVDGTNTSAGSASVDNAYATVNIGNTQITFPAINNLTVPTTYLKNNGNYNNISAILPNVTSADIVTKPNILQNALSQNMINIFENVNSTAISSISVQPSANGQNELIVTINTTSASTIDGPSSKTFTLTVSGFASSTNTTTLKIQNLNWDSTEYIQYFNTQSAYTIDWNQQKSTILKNFVDLLNGSVSIYFDNPSNTIVSSSASTLTINQANNTATFKIVFSGQQNGIIAPSLTHTFTVSLRPTPGTGSDTNSKENPLVGFDNYLQNQIDNKYNGLLPNDNDLKQIVADYLNQPSIKNQLPTSLIPSSGSFTPNDIVLDNSKIDKTSNPIKFNKGAIKTNTNPEMIFPSCDVNVKITSLISGNQIVNGNLVNYYANELVTLWQNQKSDQKIKDLETWLKNNQANLFNNLPLPLPTLKLTNLINNGTSKTSIKVTVELSQAYTIAGTTSNVSFDLILSGFNSNIGTQTTLTVPTIKYSDQDFTSIFPTVNTNKYICDFETNKSVHEKELMNWINSNKSKYFDSSSLGFANVTSVSFTFNYPEEVQATYTYYGMDANGNFINNLAATSIIKLRPVPGTGTDNSNPLNGFNNYIQNEVDNNYNGLLPNDNDLKQIAANYLNQPSIKNQLPTSLIPASGSFAPNDIVIDNSKIDKTTNPIKLNSGAIKTNTNPAMIFPSCDVNVKETTLKNNVKNNGIAATGNCGTLIAKVIIDSFLRNGTSAPSVITVHDWIEANINNIFNNPCTPTTVTITNITFGSDQNSIKVTVQLSQAYAKDQIINNASFTFEINQFVGNLVPTTLKSTKKIISYQSTDFDAAYQSNSALKRGFFNDFQILDNGISNLGPSVISNNITPLIDFITKNASDYFDGNTDNFNIFNYVAKTSTTNPDTDIDITITYAGVDKNQAFSQNLTATITLSLRPNPLDVAPANSPLNGLYDYINSTGFVFNCDEKDTKNVEELKQKVCDYLNINSKNVPTCCLPVNEPNTSFKPADIQINFEDSNKNKLIEFNKTTNTIDFKDGAITTIENPSQSGSGIKLSLSFFAGSLNFNEITSFTTNTLSATAPLNKYTANEIETAFKNDPTGANNQVSIDLNSFIQSSKASILINGNNATIDQITNVKANSDGSITVDLAVSNATLSPSDHTGKITGSVTINNLKGINGALNTSLNLNEINGDELWPLNTGSSAQGFNALFTKIFGRNDSGFIEDWKEYTPTDLSDRATKLKDWLNKEASNSSTKIWTDLNVAYGNIVVTNVVIDQQSTVFTASANVFFAHVTFNGFNAGSCDANMQKDIKITLRQMPTKPVCSVVDSSTINTAKNAAKKNIFDKINVAIADYKWYSNPDEGDIKNIIAKEINDELNRYRNPNAYTEPAIIPISWVPNINSNISPSDITFNPGEFSYENGVVNIGSGSIGNVNFNELGKIELLAKDNTNLNTNDDNNWWIWLVVGTLSAIAIIFVALLIAYIIKRKRQDNSLYDL